VHRQADCILVPSRHVADGLADEGLPVNRVRIVGRGVDVDLFNPEQRGFFARRRLGGDGVVVLAVSRLSQEKGLDNLLDAANLLEADGVEVRVALVGDGPHRDALAARMAGTRHRLLGAVTGTRLAALYASADIFCLPSTTETYGQVALEAQASGLPVVVPMGTAIAEQVSHGLTGVLSTSDDPRHLAAALKPLALDRDARTAMGRRARGAMINHAKWDDVFTALADEYRAVARSRTLQAESQRLPVEMGVL
jgi:glycosyltransferase involved in cell wall biosynthesis